MADYDLYGVEAATLDDAAMIVKTILSLPLHAHESSYTGEYFIADGEGDETFKLRENVDPLDGEPHEVDYASHRFLLYVDESPRAEELRRTLSSHPGVSLLRQESL